MARDLMCLPHMRAHILSILLAVSILGSGCVVESRRTAYVLNATAVATGALILVAGAYSKTETPDCNGPEACYYYTDNMLGALVGTGLVAVGAVGAGVTVIGSLLDAPEPSPTPSSPDTTITAEPATITAPGLRPATLSVR